MSLYSQIAIDSVMDLKRDIDLNPADVWDKNARALYPNKLSAQNKSCPKSAFFGLCEEGLVSGVKPGSYTKSKLNKEYALKAVSHLRNDPSLNEEQLWELISGKQPNEQMAVVKALYTLGFIVE